MKLQVLDCTLRDGAYIVDAKFGDNVIKGVIKNLDYAGIELVECGWLKNDNHKSGSSYFNSPDDLIPYLPKDKHGASFVLMMDYGRYDLKNLPDYNGKSADAIRVVFPKEKFKEAVEFSKQIKDKGYQLYLQAANTMSYSDYDLLELIRQVNKVNPQGLSIVDTFGTMYFEDLARIYAILNNNLNPEIKIGFHSHNNLQLSFALSIDFAKLANNGNRDIIIDASLCGMGRGAGNTCTELITNYMNSKFNTNYDLNKIMDTIDMYITRFNKDYEWGYSIPYFIAGMYGSHVNNIQYLLKTHKTKAKDLKIIIESLDMDTRKKYDYDNLEKIYLKYQDNIVDDELVLQALHNNIKDKDILILSPGKTLVTEKDRVNRYILENNPLVIAVNSMPTGYKCDYLFFSNAVRYDYVKDSEEGLFNNTPKILTSNIKAYDEQNTMVINYNLLIDLNWERFDNVTIMLTKLLSKMEAKSIAYAGFDGFNPNDSTDYSEDGLRSDMNKNEKLMFNNEIASMLADFVLRETRPINMTFVTTSMFADAIKGKIGLNYTINC